MFNLLDKYRFTADPDGTPTALTPVNTGLKKRYELQGDGVSYRVTLATELVFGNDSGDYTYFNDIIEADETCEVSLLIEKFCSGEWSDYFIGKITVAQRNHDYDKCEVTFRVDPNDAYECAKMNFGKETNWLEYGTAKNLTPLYGTIEIILCSYDDLVVIPNVQLLFLRDCFSGGTHDVQFDADPDPTTAWTPVNHVQIFTGNTVGVDTVQIDTTWKRETVNQPTPPPGFGWVNIGGDDWARPVSVISSVTNFEALSATYDAELADFEDVSNGHLLSDMIEGAVAATGCDIDTVVSNFLNINPDATQPTNDAYDYALDDEATMQAVLIYQKSDIVNPDATNDATRLPLTLTDMLISLRDSLNVFWAIVDVAGTITMRIEHLSYFEGGAGFDLTVLGDGKYVRGLNRFETEGEIPPFERFAYQEAFQEGFVSHRIEYACANGSERDYQLSQMNADFGGLYGSTAAGLNGFVFVCAYFISGSDYLLDTTDGVANGAMKWKHLFNNLWVFGRYSLAATTTAGGGFTVETLKKRKAQAQIQMPFCCEEFEPTETVLTALGAGQVKSAEHDTEAGILTLNLLQE